MSVEKYHQPDSLFTYDTKFSGKLSSMSQFVDYADQCFIASSGIESVVRLLRADATNASDWSEGDAPLIAPMDVDNMLGLVQFAALSMREEAERISEWANNRFASKGEQQ